MLHLFHHMFHLVYLFHRVFMSGRDSPVLLVPPIPLVVFIWDIFACSTCSTYSTCCTCSTGCLYLGEFYIFHLFNLLHLFARMFMSGKDLLDPPVPPVPLGVYVWERYACSTCFTFFTCAMCLCLGEIPIFHLFHLFHRLSMSGRDSHFSLLLPVPQGVYVWERFACFTCSSYSTRCLCL